MVVRIPREEITRLKQLAAERGYSLSGLVRVALRRVLGGAVKVAPRRSEADVQRRSVEPVISVNDTSGQELPGGKAA